MSGVNVIDLGGTDEFKGDIKETFRSTGEGEGQTAARQSPSMQNMNTKYQLRISVENTNIKPSGYQSLMNNGAKKAKSQQKRPFNALNYNK